VAALKRVSLPRIKAQAWYMPEENPTLSRKQKSGRRADEPTRSMAARSTVITSIITVSIVTRVPRAAALAQK
jgi:hypothetical protein